MSVPCIPGFFNASGTCQPCPVGTHSSIVNNTGGANSCLPCPTGFSCFPGTFQPLENVSMMPPLSFNPFSAEINSGENFVSTLRWYLILANLIVVAALLLLSIAVHRFPGCSRVFLCENNKYLSWTSVDVLFSRAHQRPDGFAVIAKKTSLGGFFTVACMLSILCLGVQLACEYYVVPPVAVAVTAELPPFEPHGTYRLTVRAYGNEMATCGKSSNDTFTAPPWMNYAQYNADKQASVLSSFGNFQLMNVDRNLAVALVPVASQTPIGGSPSLGVTAVPDWEVGPTGSYRIWTTAVSPSVCEAVWECTDCRLLRSNTAFSFISFGWSFVNYLEYKFESPSLTQTDFSPAPITAKPLHTQGQVRPRPSPRSNVTGLFQFIGNMNMASFFSSATEIPISLTPYVLTSQSTAYPPLQVGYQTASGTAIPNPNSLITNTSRVNWPFVFQAGTISGAIFTFRITKNSYSIMANINTPQLQTMVVLLASQSVSVISVFAAIFWLVQAVFGWSPGAASDANFAISRFAPNEGINMSHIELSDDPAANLPPVMKEQGGTVTI